MSDSPYRACGDLLGHCRVASKEDAGGFGVGISDLRLRFFTRALVRTPTKAARFWFAAAKALLQVQRPVVAEGRTVNACVLVQVHCCSVKKAGLAWRQRRHDALHPKLAREERRQSPRPPRSLLLAAVHLPSRRRRLIPRSHVDRALL